MTQERLIEIAAAVADGSTVDWQRLEADVDPTTRAFLHRLKQIERIASVHSSAPAAAFERSLGDSSQSSTASAFAGDPPRTWGPLAIARPIGRGTYADVYLARDPRLDRPVALKLARHRDARDSAAESEAIEEARVLARVRHPNVITVYGAERIDGRAGIWMELIDGNTLEQELADRGPLPAADLVAVGTALCGALGAVHAAGLLHRDVKCQNVLRDRDGRIVLTDFGTTREVSSDTQAELAGTPLYLAPEVMNGEPASAASDVYSLGVLLYRLATGAFPVNGRSMADLRDADAAGDRVPVRQRRRDLPARLTRVIERATDPAPGRRYASAEAMGTALTAAARGGRAIAFAAVAALAVAATIAAAVRWRASDPASPPRAVLIGAFDNQTGDHRLDDAVAFAFGQELMQSRSLTIVPRERVDDSLRLMKLPASTRLDGRTAREVSLRDGGIPLFAVGRIARLKSTFTIQASVNRTSSGEVVAEASVDFADVDGVLHAVRTLAAAARRAAGDRAQQVDADVRLERVTTASLDALRAYTTGMSLINDRNWAAAELHLAEAVRIDPSFPLALIMLAHSRRNQFRPSHAYMAEANDALRLAAGLPTRERHFIEGSYAQMTGDYQRAVAAYEALLREHPNDFWALNDLVVAYVCSGRMRETASLLERLAFLRPNDFHSLAEIASDLVVVGEFQTAMRIVDRASRLDRPAGVRSTVYSVWLDLLPIFRVWAEGHVAEAAALLDAKEQTPPADDWGAFARGQLNMSLGRVHAAERAFRAMSSPDERDAMLAYAALARGQASWAEAALRRVAPALSASPPGKTFGYFGRTTVICWSFLRVGMTDACRRLSDRANYYVDVTHWIAGELAVGDGNDEAALPILRNMQRIIPPGSPQAFMGVETLARLFERRGDLLAAASTLRWSENVRSAGYPADSGSVGFFWLLLREHLMETERQLGNTERADALAGELRRLLVVSDPDFVLHRSLG